MSQSNFTQYLQDLTARIKTLQVQIAEVKARLDEVYKEHNFRKTLIHQEVEEDLSDYQPAGLGLALPEVNLSAEALSPAAIEATLKAMFKIT